MIILFTTYFVKSSVPALYCLTAYSWGPPSTMKFRHIKNVDTLPQCIWGSFGINKEQIKVFKELKEHFWRKGVLYQTIKTKERLCHSWKWIVRVCGPKRNGYCWLALEGDPERHWPGLGCLWFEMIHPPPWAVGSHVSGPTAEGTPKI